MTKVAPSILAADYTDLRNELAKVKGADYLHVDVMDGRFVPNITFGSGMVKALRSISPIPLDVHLMIMEPERHIRDFAESGADIITFHVEATAHPHRCIQFIKEAGKRPGLALNPGTPLSSVEWLLGDVDLVLVMTVNPGYGGQCFIESMMRKISDLRSIAAERMKGDLEIEVDGGITIETGSRAVNAGADTLVAGTSIFGAGDPGSVIEALKSIRGK